MCSDTDPDAWVRERPSFGKQQIRDLEGIKKGQRFFYFDERYGIRFLGEIISDPFYVSASRARSNSRGGETKKIIIPNSLSKEIQSYSPYMEGWFVQIRIIGRHGEIIEEDVMSLKDASVVPHFKDDRNNITWWDNYRALLKTSKKHGLTDLSPTYLI